MKRITIYALFVAGLIALCGGCNSGIEPTVSDNCLTLTVSTPGMETKATINGVDALHENDVKSVYYFLYPAGETDVQPSLNGFFAGLSLTGPGATKTWTIPVSASTVSNVLFPSGVRECALYVVANPPAGLVSLLEGKPTLNQIRTAVFTTNLIGTQSSFVMVYDGIASLVSRTAGNAIAGDAELIRVADKITVSAQVAQSYTDPVTGYEWTPMMEGLSVEFYNAFQKANFAGDFSSLTVNAKNDYFDVPAIRFGSATSQTASGPDDFDKYIASAIAPVYTYPMTWEFADRYEPYLLFELPWTRTSTSTDEYGHTTTKDIIQNCYYKMMLSTKQMNSNCCYSVTAKLEVLGSFSKTEPTQQYLYEDYMVLKWKSAFDGNNNVDAEIKEARYLVANQTDYTIFNQTKLSIPFASSHECEFRIDEARQYNNSTNSYKTFTSAAASAWFHINGSVLEFDHTLNNAMNDDIDCTPYEITLTLYHRGEDPATTTYKTTLHIVQYPALYIYNEENSAGRNINGNVWVNGYYNTGSTPFGGTHAANTSGNNSSIDMTIITASQFDNTSTYILGDPRVTETDNLSNWRTSGNESKFSAPAQYGTTPRELTYYYPTNEDEAHRNYIAPKLRTSSANAQLGGGGTSVSYENAKKRCATYQEDGYPAGRWRLMTEAEARFIVFLSKNNLIPTMYYSGQNYWFAGGYITNRSTGNPTVAYSTEGNRYVRCVYDEWYWEEIDRAAGNDHSNKNFYWGDQPR